MSHIFENPETNPVDNIVTNEKHSSSVTVVSRSKFAGNITVNGARVHYTDIDGNDNNAGNDDNAHV